MKAKDEPHHITKEQAAPVVLHREDETVLARWLRQVWERGPVAWLGWALGILAAAGGLTFLYTLLNAPRADSTAWVDLIVPAAAPRGSTATGSKEPAQVRPLVAIADQFPNTPAARWALVRAGTELYELGFQDLPNQRETARPLLQQAIEKFDAVLKSAPEDAPEALIAAMGKARALETRGDLELAIAQYQEVAKRWPNSGSAKLAEKRARELATPAAQQFYKDFYAQDFSRMETTPGGVGAGSVPTPFGLPGSSGSGLLDLPGFPTLPPLDSSTAPSEPAKTPEKGELPSDVFAPTSGAESSASKTPGP